MLLQVWTPVIIIIVIVLETEFSSLISSLKTYTLTSDKHSDSRQG